MIAISRRARIVALATGAIVLLAFGLGYRWVRTGGMNARQKPSSVEVYVATRLVQLGIPEEARRRTNPLSAGPDSADVANGRELYLTSCQTCHASDGRGVTATGSGLYPPPIDVSPIALHERKRTDGELFYLIQNGIRNTGMPAWQLPDNQIWSLVSYLKYLPKTAAPTPPADPPMREDRAQYVGSAACKACHGAIYDRWVKTPMANVVRDPKEHPDAIIPDLSVPNPLVTFTKDDVALVYGSIWKQRYFRKVGDDYFPEPAQWDVTKKAWKPYFVKDDWWAPLYPLDNFARPTGPLCDGCHSVNYDVKTKHVTEWNVGCERCHGPGSEHVAKPTAANIVDAARFDYVAANDVCIQCHSQGRPSKNPIEGKHFDWPVGYAVDRRLSDYWKLEDHRLGETTFTHFADGTAHKNRMQGNDYVTSAMYTHGVTCSTCHDAHGTAFPSSMRKAPNDVCLDCHSSGSPNGPRGATLSEHTHHAPSSKGSECIACHMPKIAQTIGDVNVRSHTFRFVTPATSEQLKIPNACNACHTDKSNAWSTSALASWTQRSPWRMNR